VRKNTLLRTVSNHSKYAILSKMSTGKDIDIQTLGNVNYQNRFYKLSLQLSLVLYENVFSFFRKSLISIGDIRLGSLSGEY